MPIRAILHQTGDPLSAIHVEEFDLAPPAPGEVRLAMSAAPINPADINFIEGRYGVKPQLPSPVGFEGAGRVEAVGEGVIEFQPGDLAIPEGPGTWASHLNCKASAAIKLPGTLADLQAATLKVNPCTAFRLLRDFVSLKPGEWVLQNAGNSAVGRLVIQLCKAAGWRSANLVRRPELFSELEALGADAIVLDDENALAKLRDLFGDAPPRLAFNAVGGDSLLRLAKACGRGATVVTYGGMSKKPVTVPTSLFIFNDLVLRGFWLTRWFKTCTPEERAAMFAELAALAIDGKLAVPIDSIFPLRDLPAALARAMQTGRSGKVLLSLAPA